VKSILTKSQIKKNKKHKIWEKQGGLCHRCHSVIKDPLDDTESDTLLPQEHHKQTRENKGKNNFENLALVCDECHMKTHGTYTGWIINRKREEKRTKENQAALKSILKSRKKTAHVS